AVIEAVAQGIEDAMDRLGSSAPAVSLIITAMRSHPPAANVLLAREAAAFGEPVVGFDLAGPEAEWPAPPHAAAFLAAAEGGLKLTAHAGEVAGVEHIREALDLGATRIAHGVTAAEDHDLVEELIRRDVTLDLCPTSNVQAGIVADLGQDREDAGPMGGQDVRVRVVADHDRRRRLHARILQDLREHVRLGLADHDGVDASGRGANRGNQRSSAWEEAAWRRVAQVG